MLRSTPVSTTDIYYHTSPTRARGTLAVPRREKRWIANTPHVQNTRQECVSVHTTYFGNPLPSFSNNGLWPDAPTRVLLN